MDLKELLTPLIDPVAFLGLAASDTNQFRRDIIRPRMPGWMRKLAKSVPNGSELLFGDEPNKRIAQINNTNNALLTTKAHLLGEGGTGRATTALSGTKKNN